jgi:hypothetical protein
MKGTVQPDSIYMRVVPLKRTSTAIGFWFFNFTLEYLKDCIVLSCFMQKLIQHPEGLDHGCIEFCLPIGWKNPSKCCSILVWIAGYWKSLLSNRNPKNNWFLSRSFKARFGGKDRGLSTCKLWFKQAGGWIHFCMKQLRTLNSYQIFKIKNKK